MQGSETTSLPTVRFLGEPLSDALRSTDSVATIRAWRLERNAERASAGSVEKYKVRVLGGEGLWKCLSVFIIGDNITSDLRTPLSDDVYLDVLG